MDKKRTGELIKKARVQKGYTQTELGDLIGVSNKAVSRWENGDSFPDVGVLESLSNILDIKIEDIVLGEETPPEKGNDKAISELTRIVKMQRGERKRAFFAVFMRGFYAACFPIIGILCFRGILQPKVIPALIMFAGFYFFCTGFRIKQDIPLFNFNAKGSVYMHIAEFALLVYVVLFMWIENSAIIKGHYPFSLDVSKIGPFLIWHLIAVFFIEYVLLLVRIIKSEYASGISLSAALGAMFFCQSAGTFLYNIDSPEGAVSALQTLIIITFVFVMVTALYFSLLTILAKPSKRCKN